MSEHDRGQVAAGAAEIYEQFFVPALFADWPAHVLAAVEARAGDDVLDVACGTGVLARAAAEVVGPAGTVTGLDINPGMLAVAREKTPEVNWDSGVAESLPYDAGSFDRVVSQFALMFFEDPVQALVEMKRVLRPGGALAVAVWDRLEVTPGYAAVAEILEEVFGADVAQSIAAPYSLGDTGRLAALFDAAGLSDVEIRTVSGEARFASIDAWIYTDIRGWTLADVIDDEGYERFRQVALQRLAHFQQPDGSVSFAAPAHIVTFGLR